MRSYCRADLGSSDNTGAMVCSEEGCERVVQSRGLCGKHYQRHYKAGTLPRSWLAACPYCGSYEVESAPVDDECPSCEMTPSEHAYRARILADSDAVFAEEWREFQARRKTP